EQARKWFHTPQGCLPSATWNWIRQLPPSACLTKALPSQVFLYTGRFCYGVQNCSNADEYRYTVLRLGVTHIVTRANGFQTPLLDLGNIWKLNQYWVRTNPVAYHPVFQNDSEGTSIYEVQPSVQFLNAYTRYLASKDLLAAGHSEEGLHELD